MRNESHRLSWRSAFGGIVACVLAVTSAQAEDMRTIEGQVFIRTKGAETIKLSLVDVLLFDEKVIVENLAAKRKIADPIYEALEPKVRTAEKKNDDAEKAAKDTDKVYLNTPDKPFKAWSETHDASTNAFIAKMNANHYLRQIRAMADYTHSALYYFVDLPQPMQTTKTDADGKFSFKVPNGSYVLAAMSSRRAGGETESYHWMIKVAVETDKKVMLANDNLSSSGSSDSMIRTPDDEGVIAVIMKGKTIGTIAELLEKKKQEQAATEAARQEAERQAQLGIFRKNPTAAQLKAIELYPDIGVSGSPLNKKFVERAKRYQTEKKEFFAEPDWPVRLAKECSEALAAKPVAK